MKRRTFLTKTVAIGCAFSTAPWLASDMLAVSTDNRPNVLFIMTDQQHAGMMSCTGNTNLSTPGLDALANSGIRFERAYASNPVCMPSRFSLQTGLMPSAIGMSKNHDKPAPEWMLENSLGVLLRKAGYDCAYGGKTHLVADMNSYIMQYGFEYLTPATRSSLADECINFMNQSRKKPFFLFASFINPHDICYMAINDHRREVLGQNPVNNVDSINCENTLSQIVTQGPPYQSLPANFEIPAKEPEGITTYYLQEREFREWVRTNWSSTRWQQHKSLYSRLTEQVDSHIERVLNALKQSGKDQNTLIIFTSDHGDHDAAHRLEHKSILYEEAARIPFMMSLPNHISPGQVDDTHLVSNGLDLLPTICDYACVPIPSYLMGQSLRSIAEGKSVSNWREYVVVESQNGRMIRNDRYKYCIYESGDFQESLVDLLNDPGEMVNLADQPQYQTLMGQFRRKLREWVQLNNDNLAKSYVYDRCNEPIDLNKDCKIDVHDLSELASEWQNETNVYPNL